MMNFHNEIKTYTFEIEIYCFFIRDLCINADVEMIHDVFFLSLSPKGFKILFRVSG